MSDNTSCRACADSGAGTAGTGFLFAGRDGAIYDSALAHGQAAGRGSIGNGGGGVETGIKWVNDLYRSGGKVCGILTEAVTPRAGETYLAAGWGINLTTAEFPSGLRAPAGCLLDADSPRRAPLDVGMLCGQIARELLTMLNTDTVTAPATLEEYRRRLTLTGQSVRATRGNEILDGVVRGVDSNFGLIVETPDGIRILHSGEVSVRVIAP